MHVVDVHLLDRRPVHVGVMLHRAHQPRDRAVLWSQLLDPGCAPVSEACNPPSAAPVACRPTAAATCIQPRLVEPGPRPGARPAASRPTPIPPSQSARRSSRSATATADSGCLRRRPGRAPGLEAISSAAARAPLRRRRTAGRCPDRRRRRSPARTACAGLRRCRVVQLVGQAGGERAERGQLSCWRSADSAACATGEQPLEQVHAPSGTTAAIAWEVLRGQRLRNQRRCSHRSGGTAVCVGRVAGRNACDAPA